jgi:hypothetical protein
LRKYLIAALAACMAVAGGTAALAQEGTAPATVHAKVKPVKAGTKKHPRNAKLKLQIVNADTHRTMSKLTVFLPRKTSVSTKGFTACNDEQIVARAKKCKALGHGIALAKAGVAHQDQDTGLWVANDQAPTLGFKVTPLVTGKNKLGFHLQQLQNDPNTGEPTQTVLNGGLDLIAHAKVKKAKKPYGQKLVIIVPDEAKEFPTGSFNGLVSLDTTIGGKKGSHKLLSTTGCSRKKNPFKVQLTFIDNHISPAGTVPASTTSKCR